jgi:hypothetical protein
VTLCRGNCGTELCAPDAPPSLYGICVSCMAKARSVDALAAWGFVKQQRRDKGIDPVHISEMTEDWYKDEVIPPVDTLQDLEDKYREV